MTSEQYLAGAILISPEVVAQVQSLVSIGDFKSEHCRAVFAAAQSLAAEGAAVDPVSIRNRAKREGVELSVDFLAGLMDMVPTAANAAEYACRVAEDARRRRILDLAAQIQNDDTSTPDELLATLQRETQAILGSNYRQGLLSPTASLRRFTDYVVNAGGAVPNFIPSGFTHLDSILGGGFIRGGVYILGARPAVGKTSFAINLADSIKGNVLFVSLEMTAVQIVARRFSRATGIPSGKLLSGRITDQEWVSIGTASTALHASGVYINDRHGLTVQGIQLLAQSVPNLQAVIVDYLGLISPATRTASVYERVSETSRDLKKMALTLNVPVICLAQLSRAVESRENKQPRLSDLRDSGAIEQDADAVLFLHREDYYGGTQKDAPSLVTLGVAKNRHGDTGQVDFSFWRSASLFKEVS